MSKNTTEKLEALEKKIVKAKAEEKKKPYTWAQREINMTEAFAEQYANPTEKYISASLETIDELNEIMKESYFLQCIKMRAQMILSCLQGEKIADIAAEHEVPEYVVAFWRERSKKIGIAGLNDIANLKRPTKADLRKASALLQKEIAESELTEKLSVEPVESSETIDEYAEEIANFLEQHHMAMVDTADYDKLTNLLDNAELKSSSKLRIQIILAYLEGKSLSQISREVDTTFNTVSKWQKLYVLDGIDEFISNLEYVGDAIQAETKPSKQYVSRARQITTDNETRRELEMIATDPENSELLQRRAKIIIGCLDS